MTKISQKSIIGKVARTIGEHSLIQKGDRIVVAISGGADSVCLSDILNNLKDKLEINISACHFNHRLRGEESESDQQFVENFCHQRGIELILGSAPDKNLYKNEESAREARYSFFEKILEEGRGDKVALAHNLNDNSETLLLRLIRGAGLRGLGSIPFSRQKKFIRPLLSLSRQEIESYLKEKKIGFCQDSSNFNRKFSRNKVRLDLIPLLLKLNPNFLETAGHAAVQIQEDYDYIRNQTEEIFKNTATISGKTKIEIDRTKWLKLHPAMQRSLIRESISRFDTLLDITQKQIDEVMALVNRGIGGKRKLLPHSLQIEVRSGKIVVSKTDKNHITVA